MSISYQWTLLLGGMIFSLLLIGILVNHLFFYDYYLNHEKEDILSFAQSLDAVYDQPQLAQELVDQVTFKKQISVTIVTNSLEEDFSFNLLESHLMKGRMGGGRMMIDYPENTEEVLRTEGHLFFTFSDGKYRQAMIALLYQLSNGEVLLVSMPFEVVNRSADIAIEFNTIIAIILVLIGMIFVYFMAKSMTKPIIKLSQMTKKMAQLDFSEKFQDKSPGEIGDLGMHINIMSDQLEKTLSSLKKSNEQLIVDLQEKDKIVQMRKAFIGNVSHELKTPIALILSYVEGLKDNHQLTEAEKIQYLDVLTKESYHMDHLVKDLINLTELEYDATSLQVESMDFSALVDEILDRYLLWIKEKKLTIVLKKDDILMIRADKRRMDQCLVNLIINALDHVKEDGVLEMKASIQNNMLICRIFNSGSRIDEGHESDLFHRFYKGDIKHEKKLGGSGIGLSIVAAVVEKHQGRYGAYNRDVGVEFWFEVPIS